MGVKFHKEEKLVRVGGNFLPTAKIRPSERQEIYEDMLRVEKRFSKEIYRQKDRDDYLFRG